MGTRFDIEERWPEPFEQLRPAPRRAVAQSLAADWLPNREDVKNLTDRVRGAISREEYLRRSHDAARRRTAAIRAAERERDAARRRTVQPQQKEAPDVFPWMLLTTTRRARANHRQCRHAPPAA